MLLEVGYVSMMGSYDWSFLFSPLKKKIHSYYRSHFVEMRLRDKGHDTEKNADRAILFVLSIPAYRPASPPSLYLNLDSDPKLLLLTHPAFLLPHSFQRILPFADRAANAGP